MFKNHRLELNLVKKPKQTSTPEIAPVPTEPIDYVYIAHEAFEHVSTKVIIGVVAYVAIDTIRKVIIKSTPTR